MQHRLLFTITAIVVTFAAAPLARADRVVLLPPEGDAPTERLDHVEDTLFDVLTQMGHSALTEGGPVSGERPPPPETANELRVVAEMQDADWALVPRVKSSGEQAYWLKLRAGYVPETRKEELEFEVRLSRERPRLKEVLSALLRPEGLGEQRQSLSGKDEAARQAEKQAEAEREADKAEPESTDSGAEQQDSGSEPRSQQPQAARADQAEARSAEAESSEDSGDADRFFGETLHLQLGLGGNRIVQHAPRARGGRLNTVEMRLGKSFDAVPGFELRGGADVVFGDTSGFTLYGGAAYMFAPIDVIPLYLGVEVDLGMFKATTGNDVAQFMARGTPLVAIRIPLTDLYAEAAPIQVTYLSANDGGIAVGGSLRVGWRF
jgi:hypothetical protein